MNNYSSRINSLNYNNFLLVEQHFHQTDDNFIRDAKFTIIEKSRKKNYLTPYQFLKLIKIDGYYIVKPLHQMNSTTKLK